MRNRKEKEPELLDGDTDYSMAYSIAPRRQNRAPRPSATRSRANTKRKVKSTKSKSKKIGGMHQRANKRMSW